MSKPMTNEELTEALRTVIDVALELAAYHHGHHQLNGNEYRPTASVPTPDKKLALVPALYYSDPAYRNLFA